MEDRTQNQGVQPGGRPQDGKPNPDSDEDDRGRQDQGGKGGARPSPSGVPNEGRRTERHDSQNHSAVLALDDKGGRQGQTGVPYLDAPGFKDREEQESDEDEKDNGPVDETDDGPQQVAVGQNRNKDPNSDLRNPK